MSWVKKNNGGKWREKSWAVLGDSNSSNGYAKPYHELIKEKTGIAVFNYAQGGSGWISKGADGTKFRIIEQLANAPTQADLVSVLAGGNDYALGYPIGQMGDKTFDTFYGALDTTIKAAIDKYPMKKIIVFTQFRRRDETAKPNGTTVALQVNATIEMCKKYSIPVFDLYHQGNMYPWNDTWYAECMEPDGVHLTQKGQEILTNKVLAILENYL